MTDQLATFESTPATPTGPSSDEVSTAVVTGYLADLHATVQQMDLAAVVAATHRALISGRTVFIAGNGGSATAATHMASDWANASAGLLASPRVVALNDNVARLTAIANDHSYEEVFSRQLYGQGRPGDVLLLLSVSGNSPNLLAAARVAREQGMTVLAALGNRGSVAQLAHYTTVFGAADYGLTEDLHLAVNHMVVRLLDGGPRVYRSIADLSGATIRLNGLLGG
jgi:D-sedoheptulose 7-phosphate isomerase